MAKLFALVLGVLGVTAGFLAIDKGGDAETLFLSLTVPSALISLASGLWSAGDVPTNRRVLAGLALEGVCGLASVFGFFSIWIAIETSNGRDALAGVGLVALASLAWRCVKNWRRGG